MSSGVVIGGLAVGAALFLFNRKSSTPSPAVVSSEAVQRSRVASYIASQGFFAKGSTTPTGAAAGLAGVGAHG